LILRPKKETKAPHAAMKDEGGRKTKDPRTVTSNAIAPFGFELLSVSHDAPVRALARKVPFAFVMSRAKQVAWIKSLCCKNLAGNVQGSVMCATTDFYPKQN
jgi:hypothetical protein